MTDVINWTLVIALCLMIIAIAIGAIVLVALFTYRIALVQLIQIHYQREHRWEQRHKHEVKMEKML